jgi:predicted  nucleic acid-binding Zn-ribbon protein
LSTIAEQIRALEELSVMDAAVRALTEKLNEEQGVLSELEGALGKLEAKVASLRGSLSEKEKSRNDAQADVRSMTTQIEHSREKLGRSRTERETNAAQREMEELKRLIRDRENEVEGLNRDAEALRGEATKTEEEATGVRAKLDACRDDIRAKVGALESDRNDQGSGRADIVKRIPPQLYRRYELVRGKRGSAVAMTTDGTCKACNMSLPPQLFHRLRREPVIEQCPSCNRIIFFAAFASPPAPKQET